MGRTSGNRHWRIGGSTGNGPRVISQLSQAEAGCEPGTIRLHKGDQRSGQAGAVGCECCEMLELRLGQRVRSAVSCPGLAMSGRARWKWIGHGDRPGPAQTFWVTGCARDTRSALGSIVSRVRGRARDFCSTLSIAQTLGKCSLVAKTSDHFSGKRRLIALERGDISGIHKNDADASAISVSFGCLLLPYAS